MKIIRTFALAAVAILFCSTNTVARTWTDSAGKHTVEAEFFRLDDGVVRICREDGRVVKLPLKRLSEEDQKYVAKLEKSSDSKPLITGAFRIWTATTGQQLLAELIDCDIDVVRLKAKNGMQLKVPRNILSDEDQICLKHSGWSVSKVRPKVQVITTGQVTITMSSDGSTQASGISAVALLIVNLKFSEPPGKKLLESFRLTKEDGRVVDRPSSVTDGSDAVVIFQGWRSPSGLYLAGTGRQASLKEHEVKESGSKKVF